MKKEIVFSMFLCPYVVKNLASTLEHKNNSWYHNNIIKALQGIDLSTFAEI
jgi:hypothetical protein